MSGTGGKTLPSSNLYLCGMMGAGKSSVGKHLAAELKRPFVDSDESIIRMAGKGIREIFDEDGEPAFRDMESQVIEDLAKLENRVVALGGGAVIREKNRQLILNSGTLFYLSASTDTLLLRMNWDKNGRPLLAGLSEEGKKEKLSSTLKDRKAAYESAHYQISTNGLNTEQVAREVLNALPS